MVEHLVGKRHAPHHKTAIKMPGIGKILHDMRREPARAVLLDDQQPVMRNRQPVDQFGVERLGKAGISNREVTMLRRQFIRRRKTIGKPRSK